MNLQSNQNQSNKRTKWTKEDYKEVMVAYYTAINNPTDVNNTQNTYRIWRKKNPNKRPNMDANKLANVRRDIIKNNRLTNVELQEIKQKPEKKTNDQPIVLVHKLNEYEINKIKNNVRNNDVITNVNNSEQDENTDYINQNVNNVNNTNDFNDFNNVNILNQENLLVTNEQNSDELNNMLEDIIRNYEIIRNTPLKDRKTLPKIKGHIKLKNLLKLTNEAIEQLLNKFDYTDIKIVNEIIYSASLTITQKCGYKVRTKSTNIRKQPAWKEKIEKEINVMRSEISLIDETIKGKCKKIGKIKKIIRKYQFKELTLESM